MNFNSLFVKLHFFKNQAILLGRDFFSSRRTLIYLFFTLAGNVILWVISFRIKSAVAPDTLILNYNTSFGISLIGEAGKIFVLPLLGLVVLAINYFLAFIFPRNADRIFVDHLLFSAALFCHIFLLLALFAINHINFIF